MATGGEGTEAGVGPGEESLRLHSCCTTQEGLREEKAVGLGSAGVSRNRVRAWEEGEGVQTGKSN